MPSPGIEPMVEATCPNVGSHGAIDACLALQDPSTNAPPKTKTPLHKTGTAGDMTKRRGVVCMKTGHAKTQRNSSQVSDCLER
jgi:hypothetical protein